MLLDHRDKKLIKAIHAFQRHRGGKGPFSFLLMHIAKMRHALWSIISGSDIHRRVTIAADVRFPHPNGIVIHKDSVIEAGCQIMQQVTIGQRDGTDAPVLKKGCYVGTGAKILGGVTIGENAKIGANAVVLQDVPPNCSAVGIPARIIKSKNI